MSRITSAKKVERIQTVEVKSFYGDTLYVSADRYSRGTYSIVATANEHPVVSVLDTLLAFAQPQPDECPVREITLQAVIDKLQAERDRFTYNDKPRTYTIDFSVDDKDANVIASVLAGGEFDNTVDETVREALAPAPASTW